jgi:peptide subunit release factor 1 (eRF1)
MIQIIKPGTKKITKCESCGCQFSYEEEDIKTANKPPFERWIICPQCEKKIGLVTIKNLVDASKSVQRRVGLMTEELF